MVPTVKGVAWIAGLCMIVLVSIVIWASSWRLAGFGEDYCATSSEAPQPRGAIATGQEWSHFPPELRCKYLLEAEPVIRTVPPKTRGYIGAYAVAAGLPLVYVALTVLRLNRRASSTKGSSAE